LSLSNGPRRLSEIDGRQRDCAAAAEEDHQKDGNGCFQERGCAASRSP
jgi:hypothetical protein